MFRAFFRKWRERKLQRLREELQWIINQINETDEAAEELNEIYVKIEKNEPLPPSVKLTRSKLIEARLPLFTHIHLRSGDLHLQRLRIERRLQRYATA